MGTMGTPPPSFLSSPPSGGQTGGASGEGLAVVIAAHEEADRIVATVAAVREAFPGAAIWVGDDASKDGTGERAMVAGAQVVTRRRAHGKGGNVTAACEAALSAEPAPRLVLLCDGDLGESAGRLGPLVEAVRAGECDLAVAEFARRVGGGFGLALGFAHWPSDGSAASRRAPRSPASAPSAPRPCAPSCPSPAASAWRSG